MKKLFLLLALMVLAACAAHAQATYAPTYFEMPGTSPCPPSVVQFAGPGYMVTCQSSTQVALQNTYNGNTVTYGGLLVGLNAAGSSTVINSTATLNGSSFTPVVNGVALMNVLGKKLVVDAYGTYSITTGTPTVAISMKIGAQTVCTATSTATTNAVSNFPWHFQALITTAVVGTSGQDEAHCKLDIVLGASATAAASVFVDNNTAVSTAYDHTLANAIVIQGLAAGASNAATLRDLTYDLKN